MSLPLSLRARTRNVLVAGGSLVVVALIGLFIAAPTSSALELASHRAGSAPHGKAVVYGSVEDAAGKPVGKAKIQVTHRVHRKSVVVLTTTTTRTGTYRGTVKSPSGRYTLTVTARSGKKSYRATTGLRLKAGTAYEVSGKITKSAVLGFLPISTY